MLELKLTKGMLHETSYEDVILNLMESANKLFPHELKYQIEQEEIIEEEIIILTRNYLLKHTILQVIPKQAEYFQFPN